MVKRIKNGIRCAGYILLIMLLLLGSLPLRGVFAEVPNTEESAYVPETNIAENEQVEKNGTVGSVVSEKTENIENVPIELPFDPE